MTASEKPNGSTDIASEIVQAPQQQLNLSLYNNARTALAALHRIDEVKDVADKAMAMQAYARQARDPELIQFAAEVQLRAKRRGGELLKALVETGARDPGGRGKIACRPTTQLVDLGVTKSQSSRWQRIANLPAPAFEAHVTETRRRLARSLDKVSAPAPAKTPRRKKAAPAAPDEPADLSSLQAENRKLRAALYRAQQELVPRTPASIVAMLELICTKVPDRTIWPPDQNWEKVRDFADQLQNALSAAKALKL
jgi:hypothetical protein